MTGWKNLIPWRIKQLYRKFFPAGNTSAWAGDYPSWSSARQLCTGYDSETILETVKASVLKVKNGEAVYERDSVIFPEVQYSPSLLSAFELIAAHHYGRLHVTDFGGSLGSSYFQNRGLLKGVTDLKWTIVEQPHFVACGKQYIAGGPLQFSYTVAEALTHQHADVLFMSSVIQYFEKPYELIAESKAYNFDYIVVDRTAFIRREKERITVQTVPEFIYKASYPAWFLNEQKFVNAFGPEYELISQFDSKFDPAEELDGEMTYRKGFVFRKKGFDTGILV